MRRLLLRAAPVGLGALLVLPAVALGAEELTADAVNESLNTTWVLIAAVFVMLMQAGFALLEIGFSRQKNAGTGIAKILVNFSICSVAYWAVGFALAFGGNAETLGPIGDFVGLNGLGLSGVGYTAAEAAPSIPILGTYAVSPYAFMFFQFVFCAVSLAIVWGTTLERLKFSAYIIYAVIFSAVLYPVISHWIFGGGWLQVNFGMQDFAGSTVVHLIGATGALAVLLHLGPRIGKYGPDGKPRAIPGHSMPLVGLGILILWFGWFGFNPGSNLGGGDRIAEIAVNTNLAAAAGVVGASLTIWLISKTLDIGMAGNGAIAGLVAITAPSGYVEAGWAPVIGFVAGIIVVLGVLAIEKKLDDPVGALSAHGLAGIWGTLSCGLFTSARLAEFNAVGKPGLFEGGGFTQLGAQALGVAVSFAVIFVSSYLIFWAIKKTIGLRVSPEEEAAGLDIVEHGMYGYPEQFIPPTEYGAGSTGPMGAGASPVTAMTAAPATGKGL